MTTAAGAVLPAIALVCVHIFAGRGPFERLKRGSWFSFCGGAAAAYVFLYILPILNDLSSSLPTDDARWPDGEWVFVAALAGTCIFHSVGVHARPGHASAREASDLQFAIQIGAFALYNLLVGALFVVKPYASALDAVIYQSALVLHFAVVDLSLRGHHTRAYDRIGRWVMASAVCLGWAIGHLGLAHPFATGIAFAFLAGGMILNVLKEELSQTERSSLWPFVGGVALFALLFLVARMN